MAKKGRLSFDGQIDHMKNSQGISFTIDDEAKAKEFLENHNYYFRVKSYAKNYERYTGGPKANKYMQLEFAYLRELSTLDMYFRKIILKMLIDVEHFLKVRLLKDFNINHREDGYTLIAEFLSKNHDIASNIENKNTPGSYCGKLIKKYNPDFAIWNIIEIFTFGDFIRLYKFYYSKFPSENDFSSFLWSARILRNAVAHNNCLLNSLRIGYSDSPIQQNKDVSTYLSKHLPTVKDARRTKRLSNPVIHDFVVMLHLYKHVVTSEDIRRYGMMELKDFVDNRCVKNKGYFVENSLLKANYEFIKEIVDFYCL